MRRDGKTMLMGVSEFLRPMQDEISVLQSQPGPSLVDRYFIRIAGYDAIDVQRISAFSQFAGYGRLVLHLVQ